MHRITSFLLTLIALCSAASAQSLFESVDYGGARTHRFDLLHVAIDVRFDQPASEVIGSVTHRIRSLDAALGSVRLDAGKGMTFSRIAVDGVPARYEHRGDTLAIWLPSPRAYGDTFTLAIDYRVRPEKGLYFIKPDSSSPNRRQQIWTQGEAEDNRYWVPIYDYPNDRATSEVTATVRGDWKVLSNGRLVATTTNADGSATWHYSMEKPHATYLIMLAAGDYLVTRDTADGIPLEYWTYPEMPERVGPTFGRTPDVIRYLSRLIGVPYPWNKYAQVFIADFMYGGMENTTATTLNDYALVDQRGLIDYNPDGLIAHEAAHMWFGDLVTNRSWGHLWLHESYATYLASRYNGYRYGEEDFLKEMYDNGLSGIRADQFSGRDPIARGNGVTSNIYNRGSRVLHMLQQLVGEDIFWRANRLFLERAAYGNVETNDLKIAFEDVAGINLDWFFDQWIYKAGYPKFSIERSYAGDTLKLRVRQTQSRDSLTGLFSMPVPLEFHLRGGVVSDTIWVAKEDETFSFALGEKPSFMIFDAGDAMLKAVDFPRTDEELVAQCAAPRMIDRLLAVSALTARDSLRRDNGSLKRRSIALRDRFMREPSRFVREEIIDAVPSLDSSVAVDIVRKGLADSAAQIRRRAIDWVYLIGTRQGAARVLRPLITDTSAMVMSAAIGALSAADTTGLEDVLRGLRGQRGRRGRLATSWLNAVAAGGYKRLVDDVVGYTMAGYSNDIRSQAYFVLSRLDTTTPAVRLSIVGGLQGSSAVVRSGAAAAARRHLDSELRGMLVRLRDDLGGEERQTVDQILQ